MHRDLIAVLRCPLTNESLTLESAVEEHGRVKSGWLVSDLSGHRYPVRDFIPRFVQASNYADSFGMQWNRFRRTQLDSHSGHPISAQRFWKSTGWSSDDLRGRWVLDCGCGAGRFAEVALNAGAVVVALDYSSAADACYANLRQHPNLHVVQADIYALPFARAFFPFVYSLGVLQHTPHVRGAFAALPPMVAQGGSLCVDFYEMTWKHRLLPRHALRVFTTRMDKHRLFGLCERLVPRLLRLTRIVRRVPALGHLMVRAIPVADYTGVYPLDTRQLGEWALLDTFDWLSPRYDQPQQRDSVRQWMAGAGFEQWGVVKAGFMIARGTGKR